MTKKILTSVLSVSLFVMLICVGLVMGIMYDYMREKIDDQMKDQAILVEDALITGGQEYLNNLKTHADMDCRVTLISPTGEVLYDNMADFSHMENHMEREEVKEALSEGEGKAVRTSYTLAQDTRYYAKQTVDGNIIRISVKHHSQLGLLFDTIGMVIVTLIGLILVSAFISYRIAKAIIKPINDIDLDYPDIKENYVELEPLLHRIHQQNTSIKKQMEKLSKRREEFNVITENMSEGLIIIDAQMEVLSYNRSAMLMLSGNDKWQTEGLNVLMINRSEPFRRAVYEALAGRNSQTFLGTEDYTYEIISNPVREKGRVTGAVLLVLDVTEKEQSERMRREFTSNVSHELKTPLTSIYGVSDMIASGIVKAEDVNGFAMTIKEESARLISLIDDIIKLSRLDESTVPQEMEKIDAAEVAQNVVIRLSNKAEANQVKLRFEGETTEIMAAEYILDEIIFNICENAIKYNRPGGFVNVTVREENRQCVVRVTDNGIGIPAADRERVFERFYRVDKSHSKKIGGTGLGLSIVKHAVMYLNGRIELESEEGKGTTFTIKFDKL